MAAVTTPEHVETHSAPAAENTRRAEPRTLQVDGNLLAVLGVGVALFALAFGAFTHLRERTDSLDNKVDKVATELRTEIKDVSAKLSGRMDGLDAKIEQQAARTDAKLDKLDAKIEKVATELRTDIKAVDGKIDAVNARLDRLFELIASQGRSREP